MFEPVIQKAFKLIERLNDTLVSSSIEAFQAVCLCGGLGSSLYVLARFDKYIKEELGVKCSIFAGARAWSAVVRGAAIRGLIGGIVCSRLAKRAYGIGVLRPFQDHDKEEDAVECPVMGKRAQGYTNWPIKV